MILQHYDAIELDEKRQLRAGLIAWLCDYVPAKDHEDPGL
jgi:hypothetical protein